MLVFFKIGILWVKNGSTLHLLFQIILNVARPTLMCLQPSGIYPPPPAHAVSLILFAGGDSSFSLQLHSNPPPLSALCQLFSIFQNEAVGGVRHKARVNLHFK